MERFKALQRRLLEDYRAGRLKLPTLPEVALHIREHMADESMSVQQLAKVIQADPALAVRLVQVANSPAFRGVVPISSCMTAISRLGLDVARNLSTALALSNAFTSDNPRLRRLMRQTWQQSCVMGAIAHTLVPFAPGLRAERALLAGLVHNIGMLPLLAYLGDYPELLEQEGILWEGLYRIQGPLGSELLRQWQFDAALVNIPRHSRDWNYESGGGNPDYVDLVLVAQAHGCFGKGLPGLLKPPPLEAIPAFHKFSLAEAGPDVSLRVLEQSKQEIMALVQALQ